MEHLERSHSGQTPSAPQTSRPRCHRPQTSANTICPFALRSNSGNGYKVAPRNEIPENADLFEPRAKLLIPLSILMFLLLNPSFVLNSSTLVPHRHHTMTSERTYPLAIHAWDTYENRITVKTMVGESIAHFPVPFIASGGDNTWRYVLEAVNLLVVPDCRHPGLIKDNVGQIMALDGVPSRGTYVYEQHGVSVRRWRWIGADRATITVPRPTFSPHINSSSHVGQRQPPTFTRGPEYFTSVRPANTEGSSTRSRSSRSTANQVSLLIVVFPGTNFHVPRINFE